MVHFSLKMKKVYGKEYLLALCGGYVYNYGTEVSPLPPVWVPDVLLDK